MANVPEIEVEVAYATPAHQAVRRVRVADGSPLQAAIRASGLLEEFPEIDLRVNRVGIYGEPATLDTALSGGDRVEIYRPLTADPKEARRRRAARRRSR